jgi:NAD(P)H dehydrogenase (quinone)
MSGVNVLVVFYSRYGNAEKLALAAGVGAIQARANIRLRRLDDLASPETIQADAAWQENLKRMKKDYIAPREIDEQWADVLILSAPPDCLGEMERYLSPPKEVLKGKLAAVIGTFGETATRAGLNVLPPSAAVQEGAGATNYGRAAAERAKSVKSSPNP